MSYRKNNRTNVLSGRAVVTDEIISLTPGQPIKIGDIEFNPGTVVVADLIGDTTGDHTGPVTGNVTGDLLGDSIGTHTGPTNGTHTGPVVGTVNGDTFGTHTGDVTGALSVSTFDATVSNEAFISKLGANIDANGFTLTNLTSTPTAASDATSKAYVDACAAGVKWKEVGQYATTADLHASYVGGPTYTLTSVLVGVLYIDSAAPNVGERVLVKDQALTTQNGIYIVTDVGSGATQWILTRTSDYDSSSEISSGDSIFVEYGVINNATAFIMINTAFLVLDADAITWSITFTTQTPLTTKGDVLGYTTNQTRIPVGLDGTILVADSIEAAGIKWGDVSIIDHGSLSGLTDDDHLQYALLSGRVGDTLAIDDLVPQSANGIAITNASAFPQLILAYDGSNGTRLQTTSTGAFIINSDAGLLLATDHLLSLAEASTVAVVPASVQTGLGTALGNFVAWTENDGAPASRSFLGRFSSAVTDVGTSISLQKSGGTAATPISLIGASNEIGELAFGGYDGAAFVNTGARIYVETTQSWSPGTTGSSFAIQTAATGGDTLTDRFRVDESGRVIVYNTSDAVAVGDAGLILDGGVAVAKTGIFGSGIKTDTIQVYTPASELTFVDDVNFTGACAVTSSTTPQFTITNNPGDLCLFSVNATGELTIDPSGNVINLVSENMIARLQSMFAVVPSAYVVTNEASFLAVNAGSLYPTVDGFITRRISDNNAHTTKIRLQKASNGGVTDGSVVNDTLSGLAHIIEFSGYEGGTWGHTGAQIRGNIPANWSPTDHRVDLQFKTTNALDASAVRLTLNAEGELIQSGITTSGTAYNAASAQFYSVGIQENLVVNGNANISTALDVNGITTLDQTTIDTTDGQFSVNGVNGVIINPTGQLKLDSAGSTIAIGSDDVNQNINVGTLGIRTITVGSAATTTEIYGTLSLASGTTVNEFSIDGTLAGDSDDALPTEKAVKTYVDAQISGSVAFTGLVDTPSAYTTINAIHTVNATTNAIIETTVQLTEPAANQFKITAGTSNLIVSVNCTLDQDLSSTSSPTFNNATITTDLDVGGATTLDQTTINTTDGQFLVTGTNGVSINPTGSLLLNSTGSTIGLGNNNVDQTIDIGTLGTRTINIGNTAAEINLKCNTTITDAVTTQLSLNYDGTTTSTLNTDVSGHLTINPSGNRILLNSEYIVATEDSRIIVAPAGYVVSSDDGNLTSVSTYDGSPASLGIACRAISDNEAHSGLLRIQRAGSGLDATGATLINTQAGNLGIIEIGGYDTTNSWSVNRGVQIRGATASDWSATNRPGSMSFWTTNGDTFQQRLKIHEDGQLVQTNSSVTTPTSSANSSTVLQGLGVSGPSFFDDDTKINSGNLLITESLTYDDSIRPVANDSFGLRVITSGSNIDTQKIKCSSAGVSHCHFDRACRARGTISAPLACVNSDWINCRTFHAYDGTKMISTGSEKVQCAGIPQDGVNHGMTYEFNTWATDDVSGTKTRFGINNTGTFYVGSNISTDALAISTDGAGNATLTATGGALTIDSTLTLSSGTSINEFSIDGTLAGDSDDAAPTEKAVKTYVDAQIGGSVAFTGLTDTPASYTTLNAIHTVNATTNAIIETTVQLTEPAVNQFKITAGTSDLIVSVDCTLNQNLSSTSSPTFNNATITTDLDVNGVTTLDQTTIDTTDGQFTVSGTNNVNFNPAGSVVLNSSGAGIGIGTAAVSQPINIGTGGVRTITIGTCEINGGSLRLGNGATVNEFSLDGTLAGDSNNVVPTEKAVKTYVDADKTTYALVNTTTGRALTDTINCASNTITTAAGIVDIDPGKILISDSLTYDSSIRPTNNDQYSIRIISNTADLQNYEKIRCSSIGTYSCIYDRTARTRGTATTPLACANADWIGIRTFSSYDGTKMVTNANEKMICSGVPEDGVNAGASYVMQTCANGSTILTNRFGIRSNGAFYIGSSETTDALRVSLDGSGNATIYPTGGTLNINGATTLKQTTINTTDGHFSVTGTNGVSINPAGTLLLNSSASAIGLGNNNVNQNIDIGTLGTRTINIGNTAAGINLKCSTTITDATAAQLSLNYDASNYLDVTIASDGDATFALTGTATPPNITFSDPIIFSSAIEVSNISSSGNVVIFTDRIRCQSTVSNQFSIRNTATNYIDFNVSSTGDTQLILYGTAVDGPELFINAPTTITKASTANPQFALEYDATNYMSVTINATGNSTFRLSGTSPRFVYDHAFTIYDTVATQFKMGYNSSNRLDVGVSSTGAVSLDAVGTGSAFTINSLTTFENSVKLPTSGGTAAELNYYEEAVSVTQNTSGAAVISYTCIWTRIGNIVTCEIQGGTTTCTSKSTLDLVSIIPTRFLPSSNLFWTALGMSSGSYCPISLYFATAGHIIMGNIGADDDFTAGLLCGLHGNTTVTYTV